MNWFEAELAQRKPSFVFIHFPLSIVKGTEVKDYGVYSLIKKHREDIQRVVSGHWHKWYEFGRSYGPQHLVMAATRYDPNAYLIVEADLKIGPARTPKHRTGGLEHSLQRAVPLTCHTHSLTVAPHGPAF